MVCLECILAAYVEAEAALAGKDATHGSADPTPDLGLERLPLEALHVADGEPLDAEAAQGGVDDRLSDGGVHLHALAAVPGGGHARRDGVEVGDGVVLEEVDLADAPEASGRRCCCRGRGHDVLLIVAGSGEVSRGHGVGAVTVDGERAEVGERVDLDADSMGG
jgi:hypothetical protein